jgi:hypothetical protein
VSRCRRRVLYVFGGLFLAAALFVPYRSTHVWLNRDTVTNLVWQRTAQGSGYMFLLRFLRRSGERLADMADRDVRYALRRAEDVASSRYSLNMLLLAFEMAAVGLLAAYDYLFLCRRLRRGRMEGRGDLQGGLG